MNPIISIIIPVYNVEKYLCKCIDSVLEQTYKELEIILVDDGSKDSSGIICDEYENKDNRIKVIHKKNGGLSDARNYGLDSAVGKYIAFLDSDDWIDSRYIEILYNNLKKYDADISICNFKRVNDEKQLLSGNENKTILYNNIEAMQEIYKSNSVEIIVAWNKLYKKECFKEMRFPKGKIHEDEYLIPILLYYAKKIVYTDIELIYYRQTLNSIMNSKFNVNRLDYLYVLKKRTEFFKTHGLSELYLLAIENEIQKNMEYYYVIKESDIDNKVEIMVKIKKDLENIIKNSSVKLPFNIKVKSMIFKITPYLYRKFSALTIKIEGIKNLVIKNERGLKC